MAPAVKRRFRTTLGTLHTAHGSAAVKHPVIAKALAEMNEQVQTLTHALNAANARIAELEARHESGEAAEAITEADTGLSQAEGVLVGPDGGREGFGGHGQEGSQPSA